MAKVLVFCPTYETGDGLAINPQTVASLEALTFDGEWDVEISTHNPHPVTTKRAQGYNVTAQYQRARQMVLDGGYDALLTIEHDMDVPPHALQTLWDDGGDVVYGVYVLRHGSNKLNAFQLTGGRNLGMSLSSHPDELKQAVKAVRWQVSGVSQGCMLVRRGVLEQLDFRTVGGGPPDLEFAKDCLELGIKSWARFDVLCGHYCPLYAAWLWPFEDVMEIETKVKVLKTHNVYFGRLVAGDEVSLPTALAYDQERAGYVEIIRPEKPKAKRTRGKKQDE